MWTLSIIEEIVRAGSLPEVDTCVIWADIPDDVILKHMERGEVTPLDAKVPKLDAARLEETTGVVAQMGVEPIVKALEGGARIIIAGRAYDPAPFAAVGIFHPKKFPLAVQRQVIE